MTDTTDVAALGTGPEISNDPQTPPRCRVVALGASAGGLDAFERFFRAAEAGAGFAYVVVQHLSPEHESILPQLLSGFTRMTVAPVTDGTIPVADHVYVIPPNATLLFQGGRLRLNALAPRSTRQPISAFFTALATELGPDAVAVVLSGSGSDGSAGLHSVRSAGGLTIVQSPAEAQYDSMPRSAVATGDVDFVVAAGDMPALIAREMRQRAARPRSMTVEAGTDPVAAILASVRRHTGKEFGAFKRSTLHRRIQRRLAVLGTATLAEYLSRLQVDPAEADALANDLMIGVTRFFRDRAAFQTIDRMVLPQLFELAGDQPVRVWVPGCATGEEAYSIAIQLLAHARALKRPGDARVQVFATDINETALAAARVGSYPPSIAADVPPEWLERYFHRDDGAYVVSKEVRDCCIFSVHDVLRNPPFSRVDLISCRNLLIYFDTEFQARLLPLFHYALRPSGFLFLGTSETVGDVSELFEVVDKKHRVFRRSNSVDLRVRLPLPLPSTDTRAGRPAARPGDTSPAADVLNAVVDDLLADRGAALAFVDARGNARYFAGPLSRYLPTPSGTPTTNVLELAMGDLRLELSAALQAAGAGGGPIRRQLALRPEPGAPHVEFIVRRVSLPATSVDHFLVLFRDAEPPPASPGPVDDRALQLEGELRVATDRWRRAVQDVESANEELRSANEELQTMNEELQSSNEELQLSQEELQSVNEELNTVNAELGTRVEEVNGLYADLQNLFQSTRIATVVVDRELCLTRFTPAATKLYPLTQADLGRPLANLADPFTDGSVLAEARSVLEDLTPRERILQLADGSGWHLLRVLPYLSLSKAVDGVVITFVDVSELKRTEAALRQAQDRERRRAMELEAIMRSVPAAVFIAQDPDASRAVGNEAAYRLLRMPVGQSLSASGAPAGRAPHFRVVRGGRELAEHELPLRRAANGVEIRDFEQEVHFQDDGHIHLLGQALPLLDDSGKPAGAVAAFMDVTPLKQTEEALRASEARFRGSLETLLEAFAVLRPITGTEGKPVDFAVEHLNAAAQAALGVSEPGSRRLRELVPAASPLLSAVTEALERAAAVDRPEVADLVRSGDGRLHDLRASPLDSGEVAVAWRDVTDRANASRTLREADRRKDEFLAVLGHELRNPLAALGTAIYLEQHRHSAPAATSERHLGVMQRQVRALGRLVDDLLDVTRISRGKIRLDARSVDLAAITRDEFGVHEQAAGRRVRMRLSASESVWVNGDQDRIAQIVGNLIGNACKFTDAGREVHAAVTRAEDGRPQLVVRDEGIGMSPDTLAHLFEPFRQADHSLDRARGGLGLGLYLVKGLAGLMGAEVTAHSDGLGRGSEFRVFFRAAAAEPAASPTPRAKRSQQRRVLIIEDNPDVRETLEEYLREDLGHDVVSAADGEAGVAKARDWNPDVVFCDIGLPLLDGYQVARSLRETPALARTPLVAITGYGGETDKERAGDSGFDFHMTKPLDLHELSRLIDTLPLTGP